LGRAICLFYINVLEPILGEKIVYGFFIFQVIFSGLVVQLGQTSGDTDFCIINTTRVQFSESKKMGMIGLGLSKVRSAHLMQQERHAYSSTFECVYDSRHAFPNIFRRRDAMYIIQSHHENTEVNVCVIIFV